MSVAAATVISSCRQLWGRFAVLEQPSPGAVPSALRGEYSLPCVPRIVTNADESKGVKLSSAANRIDRIAIDLIIDRSSWVSWQRPRMTTNLTSAARRQRLKRHLSDEPFRLAFTFSNLLLAALF